MGCPDWHTAMHSLWLQRLLWIYCLGHAGVSGNKRADRLASTADITSGLQLGRAEVLQSLRNFLHTDKQEHHSIDCLKERGVEKGGGRHFHPPRLRTICVQLGKYWHCFEGNLGETAERRGRAHMGLSERYDAILNWNWNWFLSWWLTNHLACMTWFDSFLSIPVHSWPPDFCSESFLCFHNPLVTFMSRIYHFLSEFLWYDNSTSL